MACLQRYFGSKETIMVGLFFQIVQLTAYGIATSNWYEKKKYKKISNDFFIRVMWFAGGLAALSSITYPSISAFVSIYAKDNQQGMKN